MCYAPGMSTSRAPGPFATAMAVLFALLAASNFTKAIQYLAAPEHGGIVVFGVRATTVAGNLVLGPMVGAILVAYAIGLWRRRRWVVPIAFVYAFYVPTNLVLFWYRATDQTLPPLAFLLVYLAFALGGSIGTALYVAWHRDALA
jgi:hypothetical protein